MTATRRTDETGNHYGDLVVESPLPARHGKAWWLCYCQACGSSKPVQASNLRNGSAKHCGCKTPRNAPTVAALQKRLDAALVDIAELKATVAQLQAAPAQPVKKPGLQDYSIRNPTGHVAGRKWQVPKEPEEALKRAQQIAAIPFSQRSKQGDLSISDLKDEMKALLLVEAKALNDIEDANPLACVDKAHKARRDALVLLQVQQQNYHFEPSTVKY